MHNMNKFILASLILILKSQCLLAQTNCETDTLPPEITCIETTQLILNVSDTRIFPSDFIFSATDNCSELIWELNYSFSPDSIVPVYSFERDWPCDIGNVDITDDPLIAKKSLTIYISDNNGNMSSCQTEISDARLTRRPCSLGIKDIDFRVYDVSRNLTFERGLSISAQRTDLFGEVDTSFVEKAIKNDHGFYYHPKFAGKFEFLTSTETIFVFLEFEPLTIEFITASDLIIIQNHILGLTVFTDDWQYVAADVNSDNQVNIFDLLLLRNIILGQSLQSDIPSHKLIQDEGNSIDAFESFDISSNISTFRFTLIRLGDLNNQ